MEQVEPVGVVVEVSADALGVESTLVERVLPVSP